MSARAPVRRLPPPPPTGLRAGGDGRPWRPRRTGRRPGLTVAVVLLGSTLAVTVLGSFLLRPRAESDDPARRATVRFLDRYLEPDGRVVRRDQGGDTVSEGQAYAMLLAQSIGDRRRFELAWEWTRGHLQRDDGLLAWRWADGRVQDPMPAADADLDAAWALVLAGARFEEEGLRAEGLRMAAAVLEHETVPVGDGLLLVAGPWARGRPAVVNPSYVSPGAFARLAAETGDHRWRSLSATSRHLLGGLLRAGRPLPPDWAHLGPDGALEPTAGPGRDGQEPRYGLDAARLLTRAAPCGGPWAALAAPSWAVLADAPDTGAAISSDLEGRPVEAASHPAKAVAAAAAAHAAGDHSSRDGLLARAVRLDERSPTYFGSAWVALGHLLLTSDLGARCVG